MAGDAQALSRPDTTEWQNAMDSEALSRPDATEWQNAMDSDIQSLIANGTFDCVPLPAGRKAIKTKWVFKIKMVPSGEIDKYKARLVAGGYSQVHGIDYTETFSPVVKYSTIRLLLALSVQHKWQIGQADVKTAFVKADLDELIYVMPAEGYSEPHGKVWQLKKALYRLKQSSRAWWTSLTAFMIEMGFTHAKSDTCMYYDGMGESVLIVVAYVDDNVSDAS
ncbi:hypothetical protein Ae201684P_007095 [Aphanomyces euteiches]|uniref:Reverse transcriptase Ty1/copia-type domain-containing protein n=1 Tax=Aphanomyces euteiches TaxID=100861 RepID=A0A6G0WCH8_9STRA|nr:hypothetical protein Ae201684_017254 [Aphanomyces euteiches]KAH9051088.1 hypothetical protein Ae201684P_017407 [Aphanomyces euteiches]KAH9100904.1 hypothetical protein Ae201684P_007095 [Aphanomyces euteiches]